MAHRFLLKIGFPYLLGALFAILAIDASGTQSTPFQTNRAIHFEHITVDEGLSQTTVRVIFQDLAGFLWIGTSDGLNKYDGYDVTIFKHDPNDSNSLASNEITAIYEAPSEPGILWIGTNAAGLIRLDRDTDTFTSFDASPDHPTGLGHNHITALLEDRVGTFWVGTLDGLHRMDRDAGTFTRFGHEIENPGSLSSNDITFLYEDSAGLLWVGTGKSGLHRFDPVNEQFMTYTHDPDNPTSLSHNMVTSIQEDGRGALWIGTMNGLNLFHPEDASFEHFMQTSRSSGYPGNFEITAIGFIETLPDILWIGTFNDGLFRFDVRTGAYTRYIHEPTDSRSLRDNRIRSVLGDQFGVLWVGTFLGGLSWSSIASGTFELYRHNADNPNSLSESMIWSVMEDRNGILWVGTNSQGLNRIDRQRGTITHFKHNDKDRRTISHNSIRGMLEDRDGNIWVGSIGGLDRFDPTSGTFFRYKDSGMTPALKDHDRAYTLMEDKEGDIWIGMHTGLIRYNPVTKAVSRFEHDPDNPQSLSSNIVMSLFQDSQDAIWVGTWSNGLNQFDPETETFIRYNHIPDDRSSLSSNTILSINEDHTGDLWIGTTSGLNRFQSNTDTFDRFTEQNSGLPTNTVNGILAGDDGFLWLSTHRGLSRFDPTTATFQNYGVKRGLQSLEFNGGAYHKTGKGELLFGGINGLNAFHPGAIQDNPIPPQVAVTGMQVWDRPLPINTYKAMRDSMMAPTVTVAHNENDVTFDYVGLHYADPEKNTYAYILDGFDDDWRWADDRRSAIYTNIPPGDYTFNVRAANSDGVWNTEGASVNLVVRPPWWRTGWAYMGYFLSLLGVVFTVDRVQRKRVVGKERERSRIREMELQAQAAEARASVLRAENERQTRELEEARDLQLSMLPEAMPLHPTVELAATMTTATEVGGDYYDYHVDKNKVLTVAIGDATGHGANAGTMVTATKALFNVLAQEGTPVNMLNQSSKALKKMGFRKLFMALALARLDGHTLELAGAGMPPALLYRAASGDIETIPLKGIPLGGPGEIGYQKQQTNVAAGDTLLLMSDGFPELFRESGERIGYEESIDIFREVAHKSPQDILYHFEQTEKDWLDGHPPGDDITFVVMKVKHS